MIKRKVKVLYHNKEYKFQQHGEFIDLATSKEYHLNKDDFGLLDLGVSIEFPKWYGAMVIPRSSTCKTWGLLQANSVGLIDNDYCGIKDVWMMPVIARYYVSIPKNTRLCQFTPILNKQAPWYIKLLDIFTTFKYVEVDALHRKTRGGFGASGIK